MKWLQLVCFSVLLSSLLGKKLICYYSPILEKSAVYQPLMTECHLTEVCFKAVGQHGKNKRLMAWGCRTQKDCKHKDSVRFRGTLYAMSYACCDWSYCNYSRAEKEKGLSCFFILMMVLVTVLSW